MSNAATRWARKQYAGGAAAKCVLLLLADNHNERTGQCNPGTRMLAEDAGSDQKTVRGWLDYLRDAGLISWTGETRGRRSYVLHFDRARAKGDKNARVVGIDPPPTPEGHSPSDAEPESEGHSPSDEPVDAPVICGAQPLTPEGHSPSALRGTAPQNHQEPPLNHQITTSTTRARRARRRTGAEQIRHLATTARSGQAESLVSTWAAGRPGVLRSTLTDLAQHVDDLLRDKAEPRLIPAALDEAHRNPGYRSPAKCLAYAYADIVRAEHAKTHPVQSPLAAPTRVAGSDARQAAMAETIAARLARRNAAAPNAGTPGAVVIEGEIA